MGLASMCGRVYLLRRRISQGKVVGTTLPPILLSSFVDRRLGTIQDAGAAAHPDPGSFPTRMLDCGSDVPVLVGPGSCDQRG